jgi:hypothetical protein
MWFDRYCGFMIRFSVGCLYQKSGLYLMDSFYIFIYLDDQCNYRPIKFIILMYHEEVVKVQKGLQSSLFIVNSIGSYGVKVDLFMKFTWIWYYFKLSGVFQEKSFFIMVQ